MYIIGSKNVLALERYGRNGTRLSLNGEKTWKHNKTTAKLMENISNREWNVNKSTENHFLAQVSRIQMAANEHYYSLHANIYIINYVTGK